LRAQVLHAEMLLVFLIRFNIHFFPCLPVDISDVVHQNLHGFQNAFAPQGKQNN
jgi:hypothetical protein